MSEMIERIALAIAKTVHADDPGLSQNPDWTCWVDEAVAALKAMREPTESMFDAFMSRNAHRIEPHDENVFWEGDSGQFAASWQAMIDQAIKEGESQN